MVGATQQTREHLRIKKIIKGHPNKTNKEIHKQLRDECIFIGLVKVISIRNFLEDPQPAEMKYIYTAVETELGQSIKWKDTSPDRVQDWPMFRKLLNQRKKFPWE